MKDPVTTPCLLVLQIHTFKTTTFLKKHVPPSFVISVGGTIFIIESTDSCTLSGCDSVFYVNYQAQKHRTLYKHVQNGTIACRMVQSRAEWYNHKQNGTIMSRMVQSLAENFGHAGGMETSYPDNFLQTAKAFL